MRESLLLNNLIIKNYSKNDIITQENDEWKYLSIILIGCVCRYIPIKMDIGQLTEKQWFGHIKQNIARVYYHLYGRYQISLYTIYLFYHTGKKY